MKQYDLDVIEMRIKRICSYMSEAACLVKAWAELEQDCTGYYVKKSDIFMLAYVAVKYVNRIYRDITQLKNDFEFPPSERHRIQAKFL